MSRALPCKQHPGGAGNPPSATTSGREELAGQNKKRQRPRRAGRLKSRGGAPRGEHLAYEMQGASHKRVYARLDALCACGPTSLARRRVPLHPSACRRSASLTWCEGDWQSSEVVMTREKDEACALYLRHPEVLGP